MRVLWTVSKGSLEGRSSTGENEKDIGTSGSLLLWQAGVRNESLAVILSPFRSITANRSVQAAHSVYEPFSPDIVET
ncbi:unnamed protein product [Protopolystoma xenopodis]|uniref:Uncharacterized protein n=1 Tax=Protopolystoma xenopodis TaxID=117903 RepID=A0A448XKH4_9PLAT|nr:unnamed protein product [Protopolystoma xenopodis]